VPGFEKGFRPGRVKMIRILQGTLTGIAICKDMDFPRLGREYGRQDVRLMLVPAWDFGRDNWQHSRVAILRGVEDDYTIARAERWISHPERLLRSSPLSGAEFESSLRKCGRQGVGGNR